MPKKLSGRERLLRTVSERELQSRVIDAARAFGWRVAHFHDSRRQVKPGVFVGDRDAAGFPDLVLVRPPEVMFVELKRELGKTTEAQSEWLGDLTACGLEVRVVRPSSEEDFIERLAQTRGKLDDE